MIGRTGERFWRRPFDADVVVRPHGVLHVLEEHCKGCMYCVEFCPCDVLAESERFNTKGYHPPDVVLGDACVACRLCEIFCPEFAIRIEELPRADATATRPPVVPGATRPAADASTSSTCACGETQAPAGPRRPGAPSVAGEEVGHAR